MEGSTTGCEIGFVVSTTNSLSGRSGTHGFGSTSSTALFIYYL
jgi:hypothetical protein